MSEEAARAEHLALPAPREDGRLTRLLRRRRSTKSYEDARLDFESLGALLTTAAGSGFPTGRPYGSAHARYDVAVTVMAAAVDGLEPAAYRYVPEEEGLLRVEAGDHRPALAETTLDANWLIDCPVVLLLSGNFAAANEAFSAQEPEAPGRGERFCWLEAGLLVQNIYLWAAENALGTVFLGGLDLAKVQFTAERLIPRSHTVLGLLPIGTPEKAAGAQSQRPEPWQDKPH